MSKRVDLASKFIAAAPSAVYAAFAEPSAMEQWLPPSNMAATVLYFDFREGGSYRVRLTYQHAENAQGKTTNDADEVEVRFIRLIENKQIEQAVTFNSDNPDFSGVMLMTWTFDPIQNGTLVSIRAEDVPPGIQPEDHEIGMNSTLENLAVFLEKNYI